jgi:endonuclease/exonuclease/phosphatase family metal-dependent hydrolase
MKRTVLAAVALFLLAAVGLAPAQVQNRTTATVAAWNFKGRPPVSDARARKLAEGIADLDADVLLVCEVAPDTLLPRIVKLVEGRGIKYQAQMPAQHSDIKIAVLAREGVFLDSVTLIDGSDLGDGKTFRKALTAFVRIGKFDFRLIGVHLKSARDQKSRALRSKQSEVLAKFIKQSMDSGKERDFLIVGDYNMIPEQDEDNFKSLNPEGLLRFISSEDLVAPVFSHIGPSGKPGNLLDGYAISEEFTKEYVRGSLRVFPLHRALGMSLAQYANQVSDHLPLVARFRITADDD